MGVGGLESQRAWTVSSVTTSQGSLCLGVGTGGVAEGRAVSAEMRAVGIFWHREEDRGDICPEKAVMCPSVYERERERGVCATGGPVSLDQWL